MTNSSLGSRSALIISQHLANNPSINCLYLNGNLFNDDDAVLFARSLQSNKNLIELWLKNNNFTNEGIKTLYDSVYATKSLNAIHDSNTTCEIILFDKNEEAPDGIPDKTVLTFNDFKESDNRITTLLDKLLEYQNEAKDEPGKDLLIAMAMRCRKASNEAMCRIALLRQVQVRRLKILHALQDSDTSILNMHYLKDIPLQYIPNVLVFVQECGGWSQSEEKNLDRVYQVIKSRPGVLMSEFAAAGIRKKSKTRRRGHQSSKCSCSIM